MFVYQLNYFLSSLSGLFGEVSHIVLPEILAIPYSVQFLGNVLMLSLLIIIIIILTALMTEWYL